MNLKKASLLLIFGLIYTVFYKAVIGLIPFASSSVFLNNVLSVSLFISALSIILFVVYFFKEVVPLNQRIKISLQLIFFFTSMIILLKLPIELLPQNIKLRDLIFEISRLGNSISILLFFIYSDKIISLKSFRLPIKLAIWGFSMGIILGFVSFVYYLNFFITGNEIVSFPPLQYLAVIIFLFTYGVVINFLIKFAKVGDYSEFGKKRL